MISKEFKKFVEGTVIALTFGIIIFGTMLYWEELLKIGTKAINNGIINFLLPTIIIIAILSTISQKILNIKQRAKKDEQ